MATRAYVAHQMDGRVRLRIPAARRRPAKLHRIADQIRQVAGIHSAETNPATGSLLIHYSATAIAGLSALLAALAEAGLPFELFESAGEEAAVVAEDLAAQSGAAAAIGSLMRALDHHLRAATGNQLDLRALLPLTAAGVGLTVMRETPAAVTPLWLTLMIFAVSSFVALNQPSAEEQNQPHHRGRTPAYLH